jgi:hypothetical protein
MARALNSNSETTSVFGSRWLTKIRRSASRQHGADRERFARSCLEYKYDDDPITMPFAFCLHYAFPRAYDPKRLIYPQHGVTFIAALDNLFVSANT